jgi:hypothetical protein
MFRGPCAVVFSSTMNRTTASLAGLLLAALALVAQTAPPRSVLGTVTGFRAAAGEIDIRPDAGAPLTLKFTPEVQVQRVAPGEKDLRNAQPAQIADLAVGDRVLVSLTPGALQARRIIVMAATDIAKRNAADQQDWIKRGVAGVVTAKTGNEITLRLRSLRGETNPLVTVSEKTVYRRYAPDSIKFAEARSSSLAEISPGDQLRARGEKSEDGLKVTAEEVVFGTFLTKAGAITAVNAEAREITIRDQATNQPLTVKLVADSQLKRMRDVGAGAGPGAGGAAGGPPMLRPGGSPPDLGQMIERLPAAELEDLKPGETVVVSSTKGARSDQVTAILLVSNAEALLRLAAPRPDGRAARGDRGGAGSGPDLGGLSTGIGGLELPGMGP